MELAALTSPRGTLAPATLGPVLAEIANYQRFQLQSADSAYNAPQFKTRPNTLRPHLCRNGEWTIAEPVPLPKPVRQGETHRIALACRGAPITVFLDGEKIHTQDDAGLQGGSVGFRAAGPPEQGLFRNISLRKL